MFQPHSSPLRLIVRQIVLNYLGLQHISYRLITLLRRQATVVGIPGLSAFRIVQDIVKMEEL